MLTWRFPHGVRRAVMGTLFQFSISLTDVIMVISHKNHKLLSKCVHKIIYATRKTSVFGSTDRALKLTESTVI